MKERLAKLIEVKSLISFIVLVPVAIQYIRGSVPNEVFIPLVMAVITYFFAKKKEGE